MRHRASSVANHLILSNNGLEMNVPHKDSRCVPLLSKRQRAIVFRLLRTSALFCVWVGASGCVAYLRPVGEWNEPVDLKLAKDSLQGVRIKVDCALNDGEGQITPQDDDTCKKLRVTVGNMGARILLDEIPPELQEAVAVKTETKKTQDAPDPNSKAERARARNRTKYPTDIGDAQTEKADYRVSYVAYPAVSDHCGKTLMILIFTFGLGPCLEDIDSRAELLITNVSTGTQIRKPLDVRVRRVLGAPALSMLLNDFLRPVTRREYRRLAGAHLLTYIQNIVYSFARKPQFEAERPRLLTADAGAPRPDAGSVDGTPESGEDVP